MTHDDPKEQGPYREARDAFGRLDSGEQAAFALEALLAAGGTFLQEAGRQAAAAVRDVERAFDDAFAPKPRPAPADAAAPEPDVTPEAPSS